MTNEQQQKQHEDEARRALLQEAMKNETFYRATGGMVHELITKLMQISPVVLDELIKTMESGIHHDDRFVAPAAHAIIVDTFKALVDLLTVFHGRCTKLNEKSRVAAIEQGAFELAKFMKSHPSKKTGCKDTPIGDIELPKTNQPTTNDDKTEKQDR